MDTIQMEAALFIQLCHSTEVRMKRIVLEAQHVAAERRHIQKETEKWVIAGVAVAAAGALLSILAAPVTHGLSFTVFGGTAVCGSFAALCFILKQKLKELAKMCKMNSLTAEFSLLVKPLQSSLEGVKSSCGSLCSKSPEGEALKFTRLEVNILQIFYIIEKLRNSASVICVTQQAEGVKKVADELGRMKTDLKTFY
ncbi:hypothetical protein ILYODFUR_034750 [Ilyodon furcidens]|uniref:Uncharacterized protein n=1 Tax=Ilyodon furcidens TaxID=33524 RepID=A0ABV0UXP0_9TELE